MCDNTPAVDGKRIVNIVSVSCQIAGRYADLDTYPSKGGRVTEESVLWSGKMS